jgi:anti-sigma factor RsiW
MMAVAAALMLAVGAGAWRLGNDRGAASAEVAMVLDGHLRSLAPGHLADVASTDQHTVKPWFAGRLDFSPPVVDAAADGFPLVGGRVDVLAGRNVAALVYSRRNHLINVFIRPLAAGEAGVAASREIRGYHILSWPSGGMQLWAVSDLNARELEQLRGLLSP